MNNIEKLAIENKMIVLPENIDGNRCVVTDLTQLEAFAKALQSSELVTDGDFRKLQAYPKLAEFFGKYALGGKLKASCFKCGSDKNEPDIQHLELPTIYICKKCTHPPSSVPLEKYNKLLDALKELIEEKVENREYAPANVLIKITAEHRAKLLIAEAEGKEG